MDAVDEVQVISNGYTAENGRNNGGLINVVTKSGTNPFKGSGWYNGRRDQFNANDYFRIINNTAEAALRHQHLRLQLRRTGDHPEGVSTAAPRPEEVYFFFSQEFTDDGRPTSRRALNLPTALERNGDFSQTRITNGTGPRLFSRPIIDPLTGNQFPGNIIPAAGRRAAASPQLHQPARAGDAQPAGRCRTAF